MRRFKRSISIVLLVLMILPFMPMSELQVFAQSGVDVSSLDIIYRYKENDVSQLEKVSFFINAKTLKEGDYEIRAWDTEGKDYSLGRIKVDVDKIISTNFDIIPRDNIRIGSISIGGDRIYISKEDNNEIYTPKITNMQTYDVQLGENLKFAGENIDSGDISISGVEIDEEHRELTGYSGKVTKGSSGYKTIKFEVNNKDVGVVQNLNQEIFYPEAFKIIGNLDELGNSLEIIPGEGENDSVAYIRTEDGKFNIKDGVGEYSVFFLSDTIDKYSVDNMAEIISYSQNGKIMKIRVPQNIGDSKSYSVQVTNRIKAPGGNIDQQILQRKTVKNKFFVIGADKSPVITSISPKKGPDTGETVIIGGKKFDEIDFIDGFEDIGEVKVNEVKKDKKVLDDVIGDIIGSEGVGSSSEPDEVFHIEYGGLGDAKYKEEDIQSINRYIGVYVGDRTSINDSPEYDFTGDFDNLTVKVKSSNVTSEKEVNVIMVMQTEIETDKDTHKLVNVITNDKVKYIIKPSHTQPIITKIIPEQIQVIPNAGEYSLKEDMTITIEGENFKVLRYRDNATGKQTTNYPVIGIGADISNSDEGLVFRVSPDKEGQIEIYKNDEWRPIPGDITILNSKGEIVDGTINKETGSKIILNLYKNDNVKVPSTSVTTERGQPIPKSVYIRNPILGSSNPGEPVSDNNVTVMFIDLKDRPSPTIDRVIENVVAIDSGEEIMVTGTNFQTGIRIFLGGIEITGVKEDLDSSGKDIVLRFNAPKFPQIIEGPTKIMAMNLDGGIAVKDFTFVESLQRDPSLTNFTPKKGTKDTVVVVDGDNFLKPNPSVSSISGIGIYRLIGSRILMDGKDINEYNRDNNGNIELKDYKNSVEKLVSDDNGIAKLSSYAHSVVLLDDRGRFYTIYNGNRMDIYLSDGGSGTEETNILNQYNIRSEDGKLIAEKGGETYDVDIKTDGSGLAIKKGDNTVLDLSMKTPYKFNGTDIYGSRVQVKDKNRIEFKVPSLTSKLPGGYTITIENPDTKKAVAKDLFIYHESVSVKPSIDEIKPAIGSIDGGYQILIEGKNFEDDSKVYVDGVLVAQNNIKREVIGGVDTLIIASMPPYRRDMNSEQTDRKIVPIAVENGNGGTAIGRFTYVIPPSAKPVIDKVEFQKETQVGSAAGEEILTISGKYFKFEEPWASIPKYAGWIKGIRDGMDVFFEDIDRSEDYTSFQSWIDYSKDQERGKKEKLSSHVETYTEYLSSPVLPTVRIGGIKAKIVEFGDGYIRVITPSVQSGRKELYVVNNDFGTSNKVVLNFESSRIRIDSISGDRGTRQGKDVVHISGSGFQNTRMYIVEKGEKKEYNMPLVRFSTIGDAKDINNNRAEVTLEKGDFTLDYNGTALTSASITMTAKYDGEIYKKTFEIDGYDGSAIYLPIWELETSDQKSHPRYELIRVEIKDRKLIVSKGYSPETKLENPGRISLKTPSYHTIGNVQVEVTNPDGGRATTGYYYTNPASKPKITNITSDGKDPELSDDKTKRIIRLDYRGGRNITVLGKDFRQGAYIIIGDNVLRIDNRDITETLDVSPNKLSFEMPGVNESMVGELHRVTVINGDGAQVSSDNINNIWNAPIYIQFIKGESEPSIGNVEPDRGSGGTIVTIKGKDFRKKMEGYGEGTLSIAFGDTTVPEKDILEITDSTIKLIAPPSAQIGPVRIKVENPDGTLTQDNLTYTYISKPKIIDTDPKKIFINDTETEITIKGETFISGATVVLGGEIKEKNSTNADDVIHGTGLYEVIDGKNIERSVVGGVKASSVTVVDYTTIKVKFPETLDLKNNNLIIINPDGGISNPYDDFKYELPIPTKPLVLEAIPGYESTVQLVWSDSSPEVLNAADKYEVYGKLSSEKNYSFIGDTKEAEFLIKGLEVNTRYDFMVRALNRYGSALEFAEVSTRTLTLKEDDKLKDKQEELDKAADKLRKEGREEIIDGALVKTIGTEQISSSGGLYTIDFSLSQYKGQDKFIVALPVSILTTLNRNIMITDGKANFTFNPRNLYTREVIERARANSEDAHVRVIFERVTGQEATELQTAIPRTKHRASGIYGVDFQLQVEKNITALRQMLQPGSLAINFDSRSYPNANRDKIFIGKYDVSKHEFVKTGSGNYSSLQEPARFILLSDR